jgi:hypothetical protein
VLQAVAKLARGLNFELDIWRRLHVSTLLTVNSIFPWTLKYGNKTILHTCICGTQPLHNYVDGAGRHGCGIRNGATPQVIAFIRFLCSGKDRDRLRPMVFESKRALSFRGNRTTIMIKTVKPEAEKGSLKEVECPNI